MTKRATITFRPSGLSATTDGGRSILALARELGLPLESVCGARGACRSCAVRVEGEGARAVAKPDDAFTDAEVAAGWRRACKTFPFSDCTVHIPARSAGGALSIGKRTAGDTVPIDAPVLVAVGGGHWRRGGVAVGPVTGEAALGLAVDLGTTNVAASLVEMTTGRVLGGTSRVNSQVAFGGDVISRLAYALKGEAERRELQSAAASAIGAIAGDLTGGEFGRIAEIAVVGNTAMQHFLLGLSVEQLSRAPFEPTVKSAVERPAADFGLAAAPGAVLYCAPSVAGFVGGDHVAALIDVLADPPAGNWALLDIGTNTEIALYVSGALVCVSCASGPAFEGGCITWGMRAAPGAIERVVLDGETRLFTIGGRPPLGICGSGVLSLVAALRREKRVNARGRLDLAGAGVRERAGAREFLLAEDPASSARPVVFTQRDVRSVQLAKGAIRTGLELLLADAGLAARELDRVLIAGAFGSFIDVGDAIAIGLLPELPRERIEQIGNAAGAGVCRLVACAEARRRAAALAADIRYLELASCPAFETVFAANCLL